MITLKLAPVPLQLDQTELPMATLQFPVVDCTPAQLHPAASAPMKTFPQTAAEVQGSALEPITTLQDPERKKENCPMQEPIRVFAEYPPCTPEAVAGVQNPR
jgi:hypothetical protein